MIVVNPGPLSTLGVPMKGAHVPYEIGVPSYLDDGYEQQLPSLGLRKWDGIARQSASNPINVWVGGNALSCLSSLSAIHAITQAYPGTPVNCQCPLWLSPFMPPEVSVAATLGRKAYRQIRLGSAFDPRIWEPIHTRTTRWDRIAEIQADICGPRHTEEPGFILPSPRIHDKNKVLVVTNGIDPSITVLGLGTIVYNALCKAGVNAVLMTETPSMDSVSDITRDFGHIIFCGDSPWVYLALILGVNVYGVVTKITHNAEGIPGGAVLSNNEKQYNPYPNWHKISRGDAADANEWGLQIAREVALAVDSGPAPIDYPAYSHIPESASEPDSEETPHSFTEEDMEMLHVIEPAEVPAKRRWGRA